MSAECSKCGTDIVYPPGTWPVGQCPRCSIEAALRDKDAEIEELRKRADFADAYKYRQRAEAAEQKNEKLSKLIVEQESRYRKERKAAEAPTWKDGYDQGYSECLVHLEAAERELARLQEGLRRTLFLANGMFQMIDPQTWRDHGGDDGQGHYEGDYRAENMREELKELSALLADTPEDDQ